MDGISCSTSAQLAFSIRVSLAIVLVQVFLLGRLKDWKCQKLKALFSPSQVIPVSSISPPPHCRRHPTIGLNPDLHGPPTFGSCRSSELNCSVCREGSQQYLLQNTLQKCTFYFFSPPKTFLFGQAQRLCVSRKPHSTADYPSRVQTQGPKRSEIFFLNGARCTTSLPPPHSFHTRPPRRSYLRALSAFKSKCSRKNIILLSCGGSQEIL